MRKWDIYEDVIELHSEILGLQKKGNFHGERKCTGIFKGETGLLRKLNLLMKASKQVISLGFI